MLVADRLPVGKYVAVIRRLAIALHTTNTDVLPPTTTRGSVNVINLTFFSVNLRDALEFVSHCSLKMTWKEQESGST